LPATSAQACGRGTIEFCRITELVCVSDIANIIGAFANSLDFRGLRNTVNGI
jgi:hypothetical protein